MVMIKLLLKFEAHVNVKDDNGVTPLFIASQNGHDKVVDLLLKSPEININVTNNNGVTPLFVASEKGHEKVADLLLPGYLKKYNTINKSKSLLKILVHI
jgi:ankyrin repeat protein